MAFFYFWENWTNFVTNSSRKCCRNITFFIQLLSFLPSAGSTCVLAYRLIAAAICLQPAPWV